MLMDWGEGEFWISETEKETKMAKREQGPDIREKRRRQKCKRSGLAVSVCTSSSGGRVVSVHRGPKKNERMADE